MTPALRLLDGEPVSFDSMRIEHPSGRRTARIDATLFVPSDRQDPMPAMVLLTSSAGVQRHRELHYAAALNAAGIAALVVDSFSPRGIRRTVADQSLVSAVQMEGDAFAAMALLRGDPRIDPERIGLMGVSKGGVAAINAAISVRRLWRADPALEFAVHVAICPGCTAQHRNPATTGRPLFLMLAEHDDYTPAPLAIEYAQRMRAAGNNGIKVKIYRNAHHGWESIGPVHAVKDAQNWSACRNLIEDDGRHFVPCLARALDEAEFQAWARLNCVAMGAHAGGGTLPLKQRATDDILAFLSSAGF
jgi:dienelactone hydrolase